MMYYDVIYYSEATMQYNLDTYNPYPSFQDGQAEAITQILDLYNDGKKVIELNAPTASGKSLDLYVLGRILSEEHGLNKVIYTTPLVALVNQLEANAKFDKMPVLKGKKNYPCAKFFEIMADDCPFDTWNEAKATCRQEHRDQSGDSNFGEPCSHCAYQMDRLRFNAAPFGATTFARYVIDPACYGECQGLLIDESASLEKALVNYSTMKLPDDVDIKNLKGSIVEYQKTMLDKLKGVTEELKNLRMEPIATKTWPKIIAATKVKNHFERELRKCQRVLNHIDSGHRYMVDSNNNFRLLEGRSEFKRLIEGLELVILASGTPTSAVYAEEFEVVKIQHPIALDKRLIHYKPIGSMNYKERATTAPKIAREIEILHNKYHKKTMVHCAVYTIAKTLYDNLSSKAKKITILQSDPNERELYKTQFMNKPGECIFLSIGFSEGLDLKGPDFPLNVIAKIPFENIKDEYVATRNEMDNYMRYNLFAAVDVMQASGRCTRTPDDFSETWILDESWRGLYNRNRKKFEPWFSAALRIEA